MKYISMFSGIEAASLAWAPLGWKASAFAEVEPFPSAVLAYRYPEVPNLGDVTKITEDDIKNLGKIDLAVFGFPCQDLSSAGKKAGLVDSSGNKTRSGLFYDAARISVWSRARWIVAENVPGLLSSKRGADFAAVLAELTGLDVPVPAGGWKNFGIIRTDIPGRYSLSWRILDAQYVGGCAVHGGAPVPQRRRRVFIIGHTGDWTNPVKVLFEPQGVLRNPKKGRRKGTVAAALTATGVGTCGADDNQAQAGHLVPAIFDAYNNSISSNSPALGINCGTSTGRNLAITKPVIFESRFARNGRGAPETVCPPLKAVSGETGKGDSAPLLLDGLAVRRLLPVECERLQRMPDGYSQVPWRGAEAKDCPDGPRYKAIGNSMATNCMSWVGRRIQEVDKS